MTDYSDNVMNCMLSSPVRWQCHLHGQVRDTATESDFYSLLFAPFTDDDLFLLHFGRLSELLFCAFVFFSQLIICSLMATNCRFLWCSSDRCCLFFSNGQSNVIIVFSLLFLDAIAVIIMQTFTFWHLLIASLTLSALCFACRFHQQGTMSTDVCMCLVSNDRQPSASLVQVLSIVAWSFSVIRRLKQCHLQFFVFS